MERNRIGRYEIQRRLGRGGMGSLYLARDPGLDRLVAIKVLRDDLQDDDEIRARFGREARSVARLRHPNIIVVFDVGEDEGHPFMAMEYVAGETLTEVLRRLPPPPLVRRLAFVEDLCAGLAHAHAAGIVHRDIKPANIMLADDGVVKILDFGIARLGNSGMTQDGFMMGSVNYMSPEQVVGRGVDRRSDIFAAGAVLYEAIALEQAFPGGVDTGVLHGILHTGPLPLGERVPGVDPELSAIVHRALERDPAERYQDAQMMGQDLGRVRRRLLDEGSGTLPSAHDVTAIARPRTPGSDSGRRPDSDRRRRLDPGRVIELRRQQVEEHLRLGHEAFASGDYEAALHCAERAVTVDPDSPLAFDLIDKAKSAIEARAIRRQLADAARLLSEGRFDEAAALADGASASIWDLVDVAELRDEARRVSADIAAAREREQRIEASLQRARASLERGGHETALRAVYEVLALDPDRPEARELEQLAKSRLQAMREARDHAEGEERQRNEAELRRQTEEASRQAQIQESRVRDEELEKTLVARRPVPPPPKPAADGSSRSAVGRATGFPIKPAYLLVAAAVVAAAGVAMVVRNTGEEVVRQVPQPTPSRGGAVAVQPSVPAVNSVPAPELARPQPMPAPEERPAPPATPRPAPVPPRKDPAADRETAAAIEGYGQQARQLLASGLLPEALAAVQSALRLDSDDRVALEILDSMAAEAVRSVRRAKGDAVAKRAPSVARQTYRASVELEGAAGRERLAGRIDQALPLWWRARDGYFSAAKEAEAASRASIPAPQDPVPRPGSVQPAPSSQERKPSVPSGTQPPLENLQRVNEGQAIVQRLREYAAAWANRDLDAIRRVHELTGDELTTVRRSVDAAREYGLSIKVREIRLDADGRHATVTADVRRRSVPKRGGEPNDVVATNIFTMEKRVGGWVIVNLR